MVAEGDGFTQAVEWYRAFVDNCGWKNLGEILLGWVEHPGDANGKKELTVAYEAGKNLK